MFGLQPVMAITASMQPDLGMGWIRNMPDPISHMYPICFHSSKEGPDHTVQKQPRPDLGGLVGFWLTPLVQKKAGVQESLGLVLAECNQPTTSFLLSGSDGLIVLCKTSLDHPIWFWLTVSGLGQKNKVQEQANVKESSDLLLGSVSKQIQIRCRSDQACLLGIWPLLTTWMNSTNQPAALCSSNTSILW